MLKRLKKKTRKFRATIWIVIALLIGLWIFAYKKRWNKESTSDDYISNDMTVERGNIVNELTMNWKANFSNAQKLTFPESGKIVAVYKKVWDQVKAGDIIAKMDTFEIDNELEQAKIELENEERRLNRAQDSSKTELEILQAQKKYQTTQYDENNAESNLELQIQTIENEYTNTKNTYEQALNDYEKKQKDYNTLKETYDEVIALDKANSILSTDDVLNEKVLDLKYTADSILKEIDPLDKAMHYSDKYHYERNSERFYIWAYDLQSKVDTEKYRNLVHSWSNAVYKRANEVKTSDMSDVELKAILIQQYEILKKVADDKTKLSESCEKMYEESDKSNDDVSRTTVTIQNWRNLKSDSNKAIDEILGLTNPDTIWEKRKKELEDKELELQKLKQELDKLKIDYDQAELQKQQKIDAAKLDYQMKWLETKIAKSELDDLQAWNQDEIAEIRNNIKQKRKNIETIRKKYENYTLKANFDGVITKMNMQVWDWVWSSSNTNDSNEKYVYVENPDNLEIILDIDQTDIVKLEVWKEVQISLDALPWSTYTWILSEIDTTAWDSWWDYYGGWSTSYKAKVIFSKNAEDTILWSMTATVNIILDRADDVLTIPNIAISYDNESYEPVVMKVVNWKYQKTQIEVWISDMANTEVISWLDEWDTIMWVYIDKEWMEAVWITDENIDPWADIY